tara:strand:+ start:75 stop:308 length:234 start_codon:yes stop_codon:yes gene_type:complete
MKLNNNERNILIHALKLYADDIINKQNIDVSYRWTRKLCVIKIPDYITEEYGDEKKDKDSFSYESYCNITAKLFNDK